MAGRGRRGRGGGGARAAPLKRVAARAGAAEPRSGPEAGRACVCLCFARALKCFPPRRRQSLWRLQLFSPSAALPPPRTLAIPPPNGGSEPGDGAGSSLLPSSPAGREGERGYERRRALVTSRKKKRREEAGQAARRVFAKGRAEQERPLWGFVRFIFSRTLCPPPPCQERTEGGGKSEHKSSNRSGSAKSPEPPENPDQHVHHLLAPAAAILTVFPPSLKSFKNTSGREGGAHTESRGRKREAPGPARKQIRSHREGGRPAAQLRRLPRFLPFRDEGGGRTIPRGPGARRGGGVQPPRRRGAPAAAAARQRTRLSACAPPPSTFLLLPSTSRAAAAEAQSYRHTQGAST